MPEALCIGHAAYDISVFVPAFPAENSKGETHLILEQGGGPAANAAYLLASWGLKCSFAGLLGDDDYGRRICHEFEAIGADVSLVELRPGHATPLSIVLINEGNGSRTLINRNVPRAPLRLAASPFAGKEPGILLFDGHEPEASLAALDSFPRATSILDAGSWREGTAALAGKVDYLVASEKFALQASGVEAWDEKQDRRAAVKLLRERYGKAVAVTLGEQGLVGEDEEGFFVLPAFPVRPVDTTAAGDIFHGAFAFGLAEGKGFRESLRFASMSAALSVTRRGGRSSCPGLDEVNEGLAHAQ